MNLGWFRFFHMDFHRFSLRSALSIMSLPGLALAVILAGYPCLAAESPATESVILKLENLHLRDSSGHQRELGKLLNQDSATLLAFIGTECPLARLYIPRLVEMSQARAEQGLAIIALDPNHQDDLTEIAALAREFELPFPLLRDNDARVADRLGVTRTPEVVLIDAEGLVRYRGRIDDQYVIGARRQSATATPLKDAIDALFSGNEVALKQTEPIGCLIGRRPTPESGAEVTYTADIAAIMNEHCVECHRAGQIGPFALTSYDDVSAWAAMLQETIHSGRMPPWFADPAHGEFRNDPRLSREEKRLFDAWIAAGCPQGDPADLPPPPEFAQGWRIPRPDLVIPMAEEPFAVPAEGVVDYKYFPVDPGFTEDKYLIAAEPRPGSPAVVHHIIVHVVQGNGDRIRGVGIAIGYAPGMPPLHLPAGQAMKIPKGSRLVFEMHYTPNGTAMTDLSSVGLKFAPKERIRQLVDSGGIVNQKFEIPPGDPAYKVRADATLGRDRWLTSLTPHMHFRGAAFQYEAIFPNGEREILLNVPRYDFNWQLRYELAEPRKLPAGTKVRCTATYDNSTGNPANPDPSATVRWGQQSWEEMMIGFYTTVPSRPPVEAP